MEDLIQNLEVNERHEVLINGLIEGDYGVCDQYLDAALVDGLRNQLIAAYDQGQMHPAGIGRAFDFKQNTKVRGDVIRWIDNDSPNTFERQFLDQIQSMAAYLNSTCFTAINAWEFHYARYDIGSFYQKHVDQFHSDRGRKFSLICYLNEDWMPSDGGQLCLYTQGSKDTIYPIGGRAVFFRSDEIAHEVLPSHTRPRLSVAGWLKSV